MADDLKWFKLRGDDGKWYKLQASSPDGAKDMLRTKLRPGVPRPTVDMQKHDIMGPVDENSFSSRVGQRISSTVNLPAHMIDVISHPEHQTPQDKATGEYFKDVVGARDTGLTKVGKLATVTPRLLYDQAKGYAKDPATLVGDMVLASPELGEIKAPRNAEFEVAPKVKSEPAPVPEHLKALTDEQRAKYASDLHKANQKYIEDYAEYADKESQARAKWVEKTYNAKKSVTDRIAAQNKKQILETGAREHVKLAKDNIQQTHDAVRGSLDSRWNDLRGQMAGTEIGAPEDIYNGIRSAETEYLRGAPQSLQQFRNLMRELGIEDFVENEDGSLSAAPDAKAKPLDWETGRVHYSAIGDKLAGGGLPGNVYQALKSVHTLLDEKLGAAADAQGRGTQYKSLKADWSEYMRDWKDTSAISSGGSPLAKILQSPDQAYVQMQVTGKAADRMLSTLAKYKRFGARPEIAARARAMVGEAKGVEIPTTKAAPGKYEPPPHPRRKEVPVPKPQPNAKLGTGAKAAIHVGGRLGGLGVGILAGHPWLGIGMGEAASRIGVSVLEKRRARALARQVPLDMVPED